MAESIFHFAVGFAAGTVLFLPALVRRFRTHSKMSAFFVRWVATAFGLGGFAVVPGLLGRMGLPASRLADWWMNIFVLYPFLNSIKKGGFIVGTSVVIACATLMYGALLLAILMAKKARRAAAE